MSWLARAIWLAVLALTLLTWLVVVRVGLAPADPGTTAAFVPIVAAEVAVISLGYATCGLLILHRRARHMIGWFLLFAGVFLAILPAGFMVGLVEVGVDAPLRAWAVFAAALSFWPALFLAGPAVALVFPDGSLPGRHWKWPVIASVAAIVTAIVLTAVRPGSIIEGGPPNPLGSESVPAWLFSVSEVIGVVGLVLLFATSIVAILLRFARSRGEERAQLKWFTSAVIVSAATFLAAFLLELDDLVPVMFATLLLVPAAIVVAITRYRLYEIDTLINRTVLYLALIGIVGGLFAALLALFQRIFEIVTGETSDVATIISALILAAVFSPIKKVVESLVDQRFKPATASVAAGSVPAPAWESAEFEAAVERVVRRVVREQPPP